MPDHGTPGGHLVVEVDRPARTDAATVRVQGEVDMASAPALQHRLETLLGDGVERLVVDLSEVSFCDVPALNVLLHVQSRLTSQGGRLTVSRACPHLRIMVSALRLEDQLPLTPQAGLDRAGEDGAGPG